MPFKPDSKRPVYCAEHLKEQQARAERGEAPLPIKKPAAVPSLVPKVTVPPVIARPLPVPRPSLSTPPRVTVPSHVLERHAPKPIAPATQTPKPPTMPPRPSGGAPVPLHKAPIVQEKDAGKYLSLKDLKPRAEMHRERSADLEGLRAALSTLEKLAPSAPTSVSPKQQTPQVSTKSPRVDVPVTQKSNIIKPGQTIKFD